MAAVGTVEEVAVQIVAETPLVRLVKTSVKPRRALRAWEIVLIVLGAPIWIPLFLAAICASLAVYAAIWIVVIALFAVCASLIGMGVGGIVAAGVFLLTGYAVSAAFVCGAGLVCIGLAILLIVEGGQVTKGVLQLSRNILLGIKSRWIRKGEAA